MAGGRSGRMANALIVVIIVGTLIVLSGFVAVFVLAPPGGFRLSPSIGGEEAVYAAIPTSTPTPLPTYPFPPTWTPFPTSTPLPPPTPTCTPYPTAIPRPTSTPDHRFDNTIVGLMAAVGKEAFYEPYGFARRPDAGHGAGMTLFWE